jgi:hypothetical protein
MEPHTPVTIKTPIRTFFVSIPHTLAAAPLPPTAITCLPNVVKCAINMVTIITATIISTGTGKIPTYPCPSATKLSGRDEIGAILVIT